MSAYGHPDYPGIAWRLLGAETQPTEETEWTGIEEPTGLVRAVMIGDDRPFAFDPDDLIELGDLDYCAECGQIGCQHDGRDRTDDSEGS